MIILQNWWQIVYIKNKSNEIHQNHFMFIRTNDLTWMNCFTCWFLYLKFSWCPLRALWYFLEILTSPPCVNEIFYALFSFYFNFIFANKFSYEVKPSDNVKICQLCGSIIHFIRSVDHWHKIDVWHVWWYMVFLIDIREYKKWQKKLS